MDTQDTKSAMEISGDYIDELLTKPPITDELMYELEESSSDQSRGQQRRFALIACASSLDKLCDIRLEAPEAFKEMMEMVEGFKEHAEGLRDMATQAVNRMRLANVLDEKGQELFKKAAD